MNKLRLQTGSLPFFRAVCVRLRIVDSFGICALKIAELASCCGDQRN